MIQEKDFVSREQACRQRQIAKLHEDYQSYIRSVIRSQVRYATDQEDIFQDFFLSLITSPRGPDVIGSKGFISRAVVRDAIDFHRKNQSYRRAVHNYADYAERHRPQPPKIKTGATVIIRRHIRRCLPEHLAKVIFLRYYRDYSYAQIAEAMKIKKGSARRYVCIGMEQLREQLKKKGIYDDLGRESLA